MRKLILRLAGSTLLRKIVKFLKLHLLANRWLHYFPVVKVLPKSGICYRARRLESLGLSVEMFDRDELYSLTGLTADICSFADLGCNVGYFTCWLADRLNNRQLKGLMLDANAEAVREAQWHINANHLSNVSALHGLVGKNKNGYANFFLHVSSVCSTARPPPDAKLEHRDTWECVQAPCIDLDKNWQQRFGAIPCDLLKVDVEGSEMDFFQSETNFLRRTKAVLCEWHKWQVKLADLEAFFAGQNFKLKKILHEHESLGTALFVRDQMTESSLKS